VLVGSKRCIRATDGWWFGDHTEEIKAALGESGRGYLP
jgi:hypothetical protein